MAQEDKLLIDKLDGAKNWKIWKYQMRTVLEARELWGHVNGSVTSPVESSSSSSASRSAFKKPNERPKLSS